MTQNQLQSMYLLSKEHFSPSLLLAVAICTAGRFQVQSVAELRLLTF